MLGVLANKNRIVGGVMLLVVLVLYQRMAWLESMHQPVWVAVIFTVSIWAVCTAFVGRWWSGAWCGVAVYLWFRYLSGLKGAILGVPLVASDLRDVSWADVVGLAKAYSSFSMILIGCVMALALYMAWVWTRPGGLSWKRRGVLCVVALLAFGMVWHATRHTTIKGNPESSSLLRLLASFHLERPSLRSPLPAASVEVTSTCPETAKNLFLILEESTFHPGSAHVASVAQPFFTGNVEAGVARSHVVGGFTHLAEFAVLLGMPHEMIHGDQSFPQATWPGRIHESLAQRLQHCGYETVVFYPTQRNFRNSAKWYSSIGFDHVMSADDHGFGDWKMRDRVMFDAALSYARGLRSKKPLFVYVLTIAQHGPHDEDDPWRDYSQRLAHSAEDEQWLKARLGELSQSDRPWVLSWFGDHRPKGVWAKGPDRWQTWSVIHDLSLPDSEGADSQAAPSSTGSPHVTDLAFMNERLRRVLGVEVQPLDGLTQKMRATCEANMMDCPPSLRDQWIRTYLDMGGYRE